MAKRKPIDYTPQFGGGIFRSRDEVEQELESLEGEPVEQREPRQPEAAAGTDDRPFERTNGMANERPKVRHSFDVFKDQITALSEIQARLFSSTGKKPKLGELVQQALDAYITEQQERMTGRSFERPRR